MVGAEAGQGCKVKVKGGSSATMARTRAPTGGGHTNGSRGRVNVNSGRGAKRVNGVSRKATRPRPRMPRCELPAPPEARAKSSAYNVTRGVSRMGHGGGDFHC